jgi:oligopeptide transport system permease protein
VLFALTVPFVSPYTYDEIHLEIKNSAPSLSHIFGTDDLGRDLCTRVAIGLVISLSIGIASALCDMFLGVAWGAISGYFGAKVDLIMMRIADLVYSLPYLLVAILISVVIGPGFTSILSAMCLIGWIQMARMVRIQVQQQKNMDYIQAAFAIGVHPVKIVFFHILPNIQGTVVAMMMFTIPHAIFAETFLSFLGIGIQPPLASLGSMVSDAIAAMRFYPWRLFFPGAVVSMTILSFILIGDALRDLLDPQDAKALKVSYDA